MNELLLAAKEVFDWLDSQSVDGCFIGGLAVQRWGEPRLTRDVDLTVLAEFGGEEKTVDILFQRGSAPGLMAHGNLQFTTGLPF